MLPEAVSVFPPQVSFGHFVPPLRRTPWWHRPTALSGSHISQKQARNRHHAGCQEGVPRDRGDWALNPGRSWSCQSHCAVWQGQTRRRRTLWGREKSWIAKGRWTWLWQYYWLKIFERITLAVWLLDWQSEGGQAVTQSWKQRICAQSTADRKTHSYRGGRCNLWAEETVTNDIWQAVGAS